MKQLRLSKLGKEIPLSKLRIEPLLLAFLIPFLGMSTAMYVSGFYPFGKAMILYSDMYYQYFPFFVQMRDSILSGDGFMWTWSVGIGLDYLGLFAYYLASPLNLLSIFLPESMLLGYFSMLPIKLGLAGLFFALFLKKYLSATIGPLYSLAHSMPPALGRLLISGILCGWTPLPFCRLW